MQRLRPGLAIRQPCGSLRDVDPGPLQAEHFAEPSTREYQEPDCGGGKTVSPARLPTPCPAGPARRRKESARGRVPRTADAATRVDAIGIGPGADRLQQHQSPISSYGRLAPSMVKCANVVSRQLGKVLSTERRNQHLFDDQFVVMGCLRPKLRLRMLLQEPLRNFCQGRRGLSGIALCGRIAAGYDHSCQPLGLSPRRL
jgi:hypothetical protein